MNLTVEALNRIVAPESLAIAKKLKIKDEEKSFAEEIASKLRPGDIILTQTPKSPSYEVLRSLAGSYFDHVAVLLDNETCLQIGPPIVQPMPAYFFLVMTRKPLILRPDPAVVPEFLQNLQNQIGKQYNYLKAVQTWVGLFFLEKLRIPVKVQNSNKDSQICSDGIMNCHPSCGEFIRKYSNSLDYLKIGVFSLNDFLVLAEKGEFTVVKLPYPFKGVSGADDKKFLVLARKLLQEDSIFASIVNANNLIQTGRLLTSIKKKKFRNAFRLAFIAAQAMKVARVPGLEAFHILSFFWPRI